MECTGQNQGRQEETHHPTHRFRRLFLDLLLMGWGGCASAMGIIKTPPVLVRKPLCNQFIHYHISSRWVFDINHFKLRNFAVVVIECSFATVDRGSLMARIHRWSVMIYGILQAESMETKHNSNIHRYGTSVFGKLVVNISKSINNNNQIFWRLLKIIRFDMPSVPLASKVVLF